MALTATATANTFYSHEKIVHEQNEPSFQKQWCTFKSSGIAKQ